jgi:hypothetical protein
VPQRPHCLRLFIGVAHDAQVIGSAILASSASKEEERRTVQIVYSPGTKWPLKGSLYRELFVVAWWELHGYLQLSLLPGALPLLSFAGHGA